MKARIFAEESRKWWTLGAVAFALFMIGQHRRERRAPVDPERPRDRPLGARGWSTPCCLTFAVLMLGGKLADFFDAGVFLIGLADLHALVHSPAGWRRRARP